MTTMRRSLRAIVGASALAAAILPLGATAHAAEAPAAAPPRPVLIVNALFGDDTGTAGIAEYLEGEGFVAYTMNGVRGGFPPVNGGAPIVTTAEAVAARVDAIRAETGAAEVDVVGWSQGGLAGRHHLKALGGTDEVHTFVSVGTPNFGDGLAAVCLLLPWPGCHDILPGSPFLTQLNAGDPTPGDVAYVHLFSEQENGETIPLPGATNVSVQSLCPGRSVIHADEMRDGAMRQMILAALRERPITTDCP